MDKAFTLRVLRCFLIGVGALVLLFAADVRIRSGLDVAGYIIGAGVLWYLFEIIVMSAPKDPRPKEVVEEYEKQNQPPQPPRPTKKKQNGSELGEDHF